MDRAVEFLRALTIDIKGFSVPIAGHRSETRYENRPTCKSPLQTHSQPII
jgi:hypothetical protein